MTRQPVIRSALLFAMALLASTLSIKATAAEVVHRVTQISYDSMERVQCTAVRMDSTQWTGQGNACVPQTSGSMGADRVTKNVYDLAGQLVQVRKAVGTSVEAAEATYSYTIAGKREYVIDANGNKAQLTYDGFDRQVKWIFPSTTQPSAYNDSTQATALASAGTVNAADYEQYGYDAANNRTSLRKRDGSTLTYSYDALNRMTLKVVPPRAGLTAAQTRDVFYAYDLRNLMLEARFDSLAGEGSTSTYNGFGELASSAITMPGLAKTLTYAYDKEGTRTELTHPDGQKFTYARDGLGRASNIYEGVSQVAAAQLIQNGFNTAGLLGAMQRSTSGNAFNADFTYDSIGRLVSTANNAVGTANDLTIGQGHNPASQIASQTRSNDSYSWTGSVVVNRNYTTNGLNQYTAAGPANFTYDPNGNLTSDGSTTFVYDVENRLVSATGAMTASLTYDPMGRLFQVTGTATNTRFLTDGDELAAEYDSAGTLARRYVHSDNVDDPVVQYDGTAVGSAYRTFLMPDERGSVAGLFYNDGSSRAKNTYDEYGIPGSGNVGRFQYTGQAWLAELGMYHYKARIYSPTLGRFLQTDPIGYDDQVNLYAYVGNDPINATDPTGEECVTPNSSTCRRSSQWQGAPQGTAAYLTQNSLRSAQVRNEYNNATSKLRANDNAGRSALKTQFRAMTPAPQRAIIGATRPGLGPRSGSGGGAARTNPAWNSAGRALSVAGKGAGGIAVVLGATEIATSDNKGRAAAGVAGSTTGGIAGGIAGAEAGAVIGSLGGPVGTVVGAVAGGIVGSLGGGYAGHEAGTAVYDEVTGD